MARVTLNRLFEHLLRDHVFDPPLRQLAAFSAASAADLGGALGAAIAQGAAQRWHMRVEERIGRLLEDRARSSCPRAEKADQVSYDKLTPLFKQKIERFVVFAARSALVRTNHSETSRVLAAVMELLEGTRGCFRTRQTCKEQAVWALLAQCVPRGCADKDWFCPLLLEAARTCVTNEAGAVARLAVGMNEHVEAQIKDPAFLVKLKPSECQALDDMLNNRLVDALPPEVPLEQLDIEVDLPADFGPPELAEVQAVVEAGALQEQDLADAAPPSPAAGHGRGLKRQASYEFSKRGSLCIQIHPDAPLKRGRLFPPADLLRCFESLEDIEPLAARVP